jgi:hypothetical protein
MIWLTWRQFRAQALTALAVLAATATYLLITGLHMHHAYVADLATCTPQNDCSEVLSQFKQGYDAAFNLLQLLVMVALGLIGMFWGAPLISRELETGTNQLVWNQSVTRTRWLAVKLTGLGLTSIAAAGVLSYLLTWWAGPLDQITGNRFAVLTFSTRDIVPLGYAVFAFALGTTAGVLLRRTLPAMAVTLALFIGIGILVPTTIRPNLLPSTTVVFPVNRTTATKVNGIYTSGGGSEIYLAGLPIPNGAWVLSTTPMEDSSNQVVAASTHLNCFPEQSTAPSKGGGVDLDRTIACLAAYDLHQSVTYQPASHFWPLQWYETVIFLTFSAALSGLCFWRIRRRQV